MDEETFERLHRFDRVDESAETQQLIAFLAWADAKPDVIERRKRSYELLRVRPGAAVADIGCGIGTALADLAELGATTIGVDTSEAMLREATLRATGARLLAADAAALPLADGELAGYRAERVYQHLIDPLPALAEAMRVLEPGGRIVLVDQDWDALVIDGDDREQTRAVLRGFADAAANGWAGRRNGIALADAGFDEVQVVAETVTAIDYEYAAPFLPALTGAAVETGNVHEEVADAWLDEQRRRAEEGRFFLAMTHFLASATRP